MNLSNLLEQVVTERGPEAALRHPGGETSYATLHEAVCRLARGLVQLGINRGDRVAVVLPNLPQFPVVFYAILRLGAVVVPGNMMFRERELVGLLDDCEARALIMLQGNWLEIERHIGSLRSLKRIILLGESLPDSTVSLTRLMSRSRPLAEIAEVDEDEPAVAQYTAGAAGTPKGAELTHGNIISNVNACRSVMKVTPRDTLLAALPFFHPMGQTLLMHMGLLTGATLELHPRIDPESLLGSLRGGVCNLFVGVPSLFQMILDGSGEEDEPPEKPVRLSICGGGAIPEAVLKEFEKRFGTYILECYSTSETSPVTSFNQWRTGRRVGSLGHPIPGVEMKVVDEKGNEAAIGEVGEVIVKGSNVMRGYVNRPRLTSEVLSNGWFHTGDLGKMDINGFFYLVERMEDRVVKGGFSVYPSEIEAVLRCHPDVADAVVVGIPDEVMNEEIKACVVLKGDATVTTEQLQEYCRERMAIYKVPTLIRVYKDLPRTSTGRVKRAELKGQT